MKPFWENAEHGLRIYCGDCLEVLPELEAAGEGFDLCLTDPPYNIGRDGIVGEDLSPPVFIEWLAERYSVVPSQRLLAFSGTTTIDRAISALRGGRYMFLRVLSCYFRGRTPCGLAQRWTYLTELVLVGQRSKVLWEGDGLNADWYEHSPFDGRVVPWGAAGSHPSRKRLGTIERMLGDASVSSYRIIDPFLGSGTTLVAAYRLGRHATGIEISEEYCELAARRLEAELAQGRLFEPVEVAQPRQEVLAYD